MAKKKAKKKKCKKKKAKKIDLKKLVSRWAEIDKVIDKNHSRLGRHGARRIYMDDEMSRRILLFHDEHGEVAYDASTPQKTLSAFLDRAMELYGPKGGNYSAKERLKELEEEGPEELDFDSEKIDELPESLQDAARMRVEIHKSDRRDTDHEVEYHELLVKAIKGRDGEYAYMAFNMSQDYSRHHQWDFEYACKIPKKHEHVVRMLGEEEKKDLKAFRKKYK